MDDEDLLPNFYEYVRTAFSETTTIDNQNLVNSLSKKRLGEIGERLYAYEEYLDAPKQLTSGDKVLGLNLLLPYKFKKAAPCEFCPILNNVNIPPTGNMNRTIRWATDNIENQLNHLKSVLLLSHRITLSSPLNYLRLLSSHHYLQKDLEVYIRTELVHFLNLLHHLEPLIRVGIVRFLPEELLSQQTQLLILQKNLKEHKRKVNELVTYAKETEFKLSEQFISEGKNYLDVNATVRYDTGLPIHLPYEYHYITQTYSSFLSNYISTTSLDSSLLINDLYSLKMLSLLNKKQSSRHITKATRKSFIDIDGFNELMRLPVPDSRNLSMDDMVNIRLNDASFSTYREALIDSLLGASTFDDDPIDTLNHIKNTLNQGKNELERDMSKSSFLKNMLGSKSSILFNVILDASVTMGSRTLGNAAKKAIKYIDDSEERRLKRALHQHYAIWCDT
jgi:hypothetical protein